MKHENRKAYLTPSAEVICLVPDETVASSWTYGNQPWNSQSQFSWGDQTPASGTNLIWYDFNFGTDEIDPK